MTVETYPTRKLIDTVYIRYLSNGDITHLSVPLVTPQLPTWWTAPYPTHTAQNIMYGGNITGAYSHDSPMYTASYVDQENDTVGAVVYPMSVITSTTWQLATSAAKDSLDVVVQKNSFDGAKGFFGDRSAHRI